MSFSLLAAILLGLVSGWAVCSPHIGEKRAFKGSLARSNTLLEERERLVQILRDLELDHETQKISEEEFGLMNRQIRAELAGVLERLQNESRRESSHESKK